MILALASGVLRDICSRFAIQSIGRDREWKLHYECSDEIIF